MCLSQSDMELKIFYQDKKDWRWYYQYSKKLLKPAYEIKRVGYLSEVGPLTVIC